LQRGSRRPCHPHHPKIKLLNIPLIHRIELGESGSVVLDMARGYCVGKDRLVAQAQNYFRGNLKDLRTKFKAILSSTPTYNRKGNRGLLI
jgi:hypothetical protein